MPFRNVAPIYILTNNVEVWLTVSVPYKASILIICESDKYQMFIFSL